MFHVLSLLAMCTLYVSFDVRLSHLNKEYLLTYSKKLAALQRDWKWRRKVQRGAGDH